MKKEKGVWIYSMVLLAAAILLIVISAVSLHHPMASLEDEKESPFYQNVEQGVVELIAERDKIVVENSDLKHKITELETALTQQEKLLAELQTLYTATESVILLEKQVEEGAWETALATYQGISKDLLSESALSVYTECETALTEKGYIKTENTEE